MYESILHMCRTKSYKTKDAVQATHGMYISPFGYIPDFEFHPYRRVSSFSKFRLFTFLPSLRVNGLAIVYNFHSTGYILILHLL